MKAVFLVVLLALFCSPLAAKPLVLGDHSEAIALGPYTGYLEDPSRTLELADLEGRTFAPVESDALNFGFSQSRFWLQFQIVNPTDRTLTRVLDLRNFLLDKVVLYVPDEQGGYQVQTKGRLYPEQSAHEVSRFYHFTLSLPPHSERRYFLQIESSDSIGFPMVLSTDAQQQHYQVQDTLFLTLYSGLIFSTVLFAIFMLFLLRERVLAYYLAFLTFHHLVAIMLMEGVPTSLFGVDNLFVTRDMLPFAINLAILMAILFQRQFLDFEKTDPALFKISQWMAGAMSSMAVVSLILPHFYAIQVTAMVCMVVGASMMYCCLAQFKRFSAARHFVVAWSAGIAGATIYGLKVLEIVPVNNFTTYSWHVGTVLEAALFSFTIAYRINSERRERLRTQTELAERERALRVTQEQLLQAETAAKEELENRVRERTLDISRILSELEHENKELIELSINDGLTRIRNRRFFNDIYPQLWNEALQNGQWLSVLMLDIDHFKQINDEYGHLMGDRCLVMVAGILKKMVSRPTDVVCRYGGEEFILLLPQTDADSARWLAERIRRKISESICELDTKQVTMTASFGVAGMIPESGLDAMKLISVCDNALYESKENGRDRVTLAGKPEAPDNVAPFNRHVQR